MYAHDTVHNRFVASSAWLEGAFTFAPCEMVESLKVIRNQAVVRWSACMCLTAGFGLGENFSSTDEALGVALLQRWAAGRGG